jgi:hypothetical protein
VQRRHGVFQEALELPFAGIIQIRFGGYFSPAAQYTRRRTPSVCRLRGSVDSKRIQIKPTSKVGGLFYFSSAELVTSALATHYFWSDSKDQFTSENVPFW